LILCIQTNPSGPCEVDQVVLEEELAKTPWAWEAGPRTLLVHL